MLRKEDFNSKPYFLQPIKFPEVTVIYAKDQPEYTPLPVHKQADGTVISCWYMPVWERIKFLFSGKVYIGTLTFNEPLQPLRVTTTFYKDQK